MNKSEKKISKACEEVCELVDELGEPSKMTKEEWIGFLDELIGDLRSRLDVAKDELEESAK